jgi:hypothetical protein
MGSKSWCMDRGSLRYASMDMSREYEARSAGDVRDNVAPRMIGKPAWLTEEFARVFPNACGAR